LGAKTGDTKVTGFFISTEDGLCVNPTGLVDPKVKLK